MDSHAPEFIFLMPFLLSLEVYRCMKRNKSYGKFIVIEIQKIRDIFQTYRSEFCSVDSCSYRSVDSGVTLDHSIHTHFKME